jgi:DNA-binding transcriptional LysR family regulator
LSGLNQLLSAWLLSLGKRGPEHQQTASRLRFGRFILQNILVFREHVVDHSLPRATHLLRDELKNIQVTISSDYSPDLAEALVRSRLDLAFLRAEPTFDLCYERAADRPDVERLSPHQPRSNSPAGTLGEIFISGSNKATVLRAVTEDYLRRSGLDIKLDHGVDNMAMAMPLVASTRGLALMPVYAENLLPWSVVSRPLEGEAPTIDLAVGYSKANPSPILKLFLSRIDDLTARISGKAPPNDRTGIGRCASMTRVQTVAAGQQATRCPACERPSCPEWHPFGSCDLLHYGAICRIASAQPATIRISKRLKPNNSNLETSM